MELDDALSQISEIRTQMAQSQLFRGYRSLTTGFSGAVAIGAAWGQPMVEKWCAGRSGAWGNGRLEGFLWVWISAAAMCLVVSGIEMGVRVWRSGSKLQQQLTLAAVEQFLPAVVAGGVLAYVLPTFAPETAWMLPGLWMMVFGLGILASRRLLPWEIFWIGAYYLLAGTLALMRARGTYAFWPWSMGLGFGMGQLLLAGVLYCKLERGHE